MVTNYRVDHLLIQAPGLKESRLAEKDKMMQRFTGSFAASKMTRTYNANGASQGARQYGGVAILTIGDSTAAVAKTDTDPTDLGGWCCQDIKGVGLVSSRLHSICGPCKTQRGDLSVCKQH